ncbi:MAG: bifunctional metallophosphatase/5'-nucleotidase [Clostridia bacterium]|nr:bifunctional metallophosphatase/5'-nucleotidase [Clostridia bacterium]
MKKKIFWRLIPSLVAIVLAFSLCWIACAQSGQRNGEITILFTNDLHSHLLPSVNESGEGEYGGYARLMTLIKQQKAKSPDAVLLDGGDFSMGSLFQTAYTTQALELRMMGAMGYDVTTFGNHEYDYLQKGLASMLKAAAESGDPVPKIVCANYMPPVEGAEGYDHAIWEAMDTYGVKDYVIMERGGVYYAVFGILGYDADDCAPNSGMAMEDPISCAQETVDAAVKECEQTYGAHPIVICLSHSGTDDKGKGEDYELAKAVSGIDVIVSAHTHTILEQPVTVNGTLIVSAGEYGRYLGVLKIKMKDGAPVLSDYALLAVDETVADDAKTAALINEYKILVEEGYLSKYGMAFDDVLVNNRFVFDKVGEVYATQHESTLGNLFSDAYKNAAEQATGKKVDVALTATGVIRGSIPIGSVTVSDVFNAASLGVGTEGELLSIYLTGADLKNAIELDASIQPLMPSAQLFMSGVEYSFNRCRMIFNKVDYAMLRNEDGTLTEIENDKLYHVVAGSYMGQMLGSVEETSMGIISITPRDENGNPIIGNDIFNYAVKDENGNPVKEWYAIASYLRDMGGEMDETYASPDGRKVVYSSMNPVKLLRNANIFTYIALILIIALTAGTAFAVWAIVRKIRKKKYKNLNHLPGIEEI